MNQQSDASLHTDNLRKMAINFFPTPPKSSRPMIQLSNG